MSQPVSLGQSTYIGTVGTVLVTDRPAQLIRAVQWGTFVGTVILYNAPSAAGTTATNAVGTLGNPATAVAGAVELGFGVSKGIVYASTGTPNVTLVWD